jgi:hypothetical protein
MFWGADRNYSFKAEKGKLDAGTRLFQTMISSFESNLYWFNKYLQLVETLSQTSFDSIRRVGDLGRYVAATKDEISFARRQAFEWQQALQQRINASFREYIPGMETFRNPFDGRTVELPSGYASAWADALGGYALSDDPGFDPHPGSNRNWQRVPANR